MLDMIIAAKNSLFLKVLEKTKLIYFSNFRYKTSTHPCSNARFLCCKIKLDYDKLPVRFEGISFAQPYLGHHTNFLSNLSNVLY